MAKVIFDLDDTLIKGQSQKYLIFYLYKKGLIGLFDLLIILGWFFGYSLNIFKDPAVIFNFAFKIIKGKNEEELKVLIGNFYNEVLEKKLNPKVIGRLEAHKKKGDDIYLVTNAIRPIADSAAKKLGIAKVISTKMETANGKYTGKIKGRIVYGKEKIAAVKKILDKNDPGASYAYADHFSDIGFLCLVGHPVLVAPSQKTINGLNSKLAGGQTVEILN